jgi:hypothetical protein
MSPPPPLPWSVRTGPERLILLLAAALVVAGALVAGASFCGVAPVCVWKAVTGIPCASCGGTRAVGMLVHGQWSSALVMNPAVVAAVVCSGPVVIYAMLVVVFRVEPWRPCAVTVRLLRILFVAVLAANWLFVILAGRV